MRLSPSPGETPTRSACDACAPLFSALEARLEAIRTASGRAAAAAEADEEGAVNKLLRAVSRLRAERAEAELALQAETEYISNRAARAAAAALADAAVARAERDAAIASSRATSPALSTASATTVSAAAAAESDAEGIFLREAGAAAAASRMWRESLATRLSKGLVIDADSVALIAHEVDAFVASSTASGLAAVSPPPNPLGLGRFSRLDSVERGLLSSSSMATPPRGGGLRGKHVTPDGRITAIGGGVAPGGLSS
jgi:hypothetical protein